MTNEQDVQITDSLMPKCDELSRMADALTSALVCCLKHQR